MKSIIFAIVLAGMVIGGISSKNKADSTAVKEKKETPASQELEITGWLPWWRETEAIDTINTSQGKLSVVLPVWYRIDENGQLVEIPSKQKKEVIEVANSKGIGLIATVSNAEGYDFDPERVSLILGNEILQDRLIQDMVETAKKNGFSGWDIDWEKVKEVDRDLFSQFIKKTAERFRESGLMLSVCVHAQTGNKNDWDGVDGQDLYTIAQYADYLRIMAYDFHYAGSAPGSVTPVVKLEEVLSYSLTVIPVGKLVLGLPTYGYVWNGSGGRSLQYVEAVKLIEENSIEVERDAASFSMTGSYMEEGIENVVWYEDAESLVQKVNVARRYGVYKFSLWHLGGEDPAIWEKLQNVKKTSSDQ